MRRTLVVAVAGVAALGGLTTWPQAASAKRRPAGNDVTEIEAVLGLQGAAGTGVNLPLAFRLKSKRPRLLDVEVQYGIDRNADGLVLEDEFRRATEDRLDERDTRENQPPQLFRAGPNPGARNVYVWKSLADIGATRNVVFEYLLSTNGRLVPDPVNEGSFLFAPFGLGVQIRMRALRGHGKKGAWVVSGPFGIDNTSPPSMTFDSFETGSPVTIRWTVFDVNSEDLNGNGQLDVADGEDMNGNGQLDDEHCGVAFDWYRLAAGEDPAAFTNVQLDALEWSPCTRVAGAGDNDSLDARSGVPVPTTGELAGVPSAPPGVGRHWRFVWDVAKDAGPGDYILRARPFDETRATGQWVYSRTVVRGGD